MAMLSSKKRVEDTDDFVAEARKTRQEILERVQAEPEVRQLESEKAELMQQRAELLAEAERLGAQCEQMLATRNLTPQELGELLLSRDPATPLWNAEAYEGMRLRRLALQRAAGLVGDKIRAKDIQILRRVQEREQPAFFELTCRILEKLIELKRLVGVLREFSICQGSPFFPLGIDLWHTAARDCWSTTAYFQDWNGVDLKRLQNLIDRFREVGKEG